MPVDSRSHILDFICFLFINFSHIYHHITGDKPTWWRGVCIEVMDKKWNIISKFVETLFFAVLTVIVFSGCKGENPWIIGIGWIIGVGFALIVIANLRTTFFLLRSYKSSAQTETQMEAKMAAKIKLAEIGLSEYNATTENSKVELEIAKVNLSIAETELEKAKIELGKAKIDLKIAKI